MTDRGGTGKEMLLPGEAPGGWRAGSRATPPPWEVRLVPPGLEKSRACLLGVGLSLYRRPATVRSEVFLRALVAWWESLALLDLESKPAVVRRDDLGEDLPFPPDRGDAVRDVGEGAIPQPGTGVVPLPGSPLPETGGVQSGPAGHRWVERASQPRPAERGAGESAGQVGVDDVRPVQGRSASHRPRESAETAERPAMEPAGCEQDGQPAGLMGQLERKKSAVPMVEAPIDLEGGLYTQLGGVLYLINLMAYLDLPTCFEADWGLESRIGSWGALELLGRGLLAWENVGCEEDSLWAALARLDGREPGELPGTNFSGGERFRLPVEWFAGLGEEEGAYHYAARGEQLRLWIETVAASNRNSRSGENLSPGEVRWGGGRAAPRIFEAAGCVLADILRAGARPKAQAAAELQRYLAVAAPALTRAAFDRAPLAQLEGPLLAGLNPHLARWLALVLPAVRLRLRRALNPPEGEAWNLAEALLLCPGRLYVTSTHIDLVIGLDSISLPLRLAGLDRNPGWMADLGRVVSFHYE